MICEFCIAQCEEIASMFTAQFTRHLSTCRTICVESLWKYGRMLSTIGSLHWRDDFFFDYFIITFSSRTTFTNRRKSKLIDVHFRREEGIPVRCLWTDCLTKGESRVAGWSTHRVFVALEWPSSDNLFVYFKRKISKSLFFFRLSTKIIRNTFENFAWDTTYLRHRRLDWFHTWFSFQRHVLEREISV